MHTKSFQQCNDLIVSHASLLPQIVCVSIYRHNIQAPLLSHTHTETHSLVYCTHIHTHLLVNSKQINKIPNKPCGNSL